MDLGYDFRMIYYDFEHFKNDISSLGTLCEPFKPDTIVAVARGGMTLAHALCMHLEVRNLQSIRCESYDETEQRNDITILGNSHFPDSKSILVVDDIVDSGKTLYALLPILQQNNPDVIFKTASLFTKPTALIQPDFTLYEATDWIDFFWERDFLKPDSL
jgi:xanthine phosphoribosyltransferase